MTVVMPEWMTSWAVLAWWHDLVSFHTNNFRNHQKYIYKCKNIVISSFSFFFMKSNPLTVVGRLKIDTAHSVDIAR